MRRYSTVGFNSGNIQPIVIYDNAHTEKAQILKDNQGKAAIYRWVNKVNGKTYIGSSVNLSVRLYKYYSLKHIAEKKTPIHNALLKYGFDKFKLEILEYCKEDINPIDREQYYFSKLKPEYNILDEAGSSLGFKHRMETIEFLLRPRTIEQSDGARVKMKERLPFARLKRAGYAAASAETRQNLSLAATGRVLTEEDKRKLSEGRKGIILTVETRAKISAAAVSLRGVGVLVKNNNTDVNMEFASLTEAAKYIGVSRPAVKKYVDTGKLIQGIYLVTTL
uniref:GIY-YIG endonuclease n=1 Tax=Juglanconis oblonga TaxID=1940568 RepID=A0A291LIW6_9PEZI|nr:GIY-YIG endonuclease [Juglanconis oblonga]ATI20352.1 GIY-YIG endonuclease [Juglanconis oblonga]